MSQHEPAQTPVAFLGLGVMGGPMAGHLANAGYPVTVYNRTAAKAEAWVAEHGGRHATTPAEAAKGAAIVFSCVGNDDDLRSITLGEDGASSPPPPRSTVSTSSTRRFPVGRRVPRTAS